MSEKARFEHEIITDMSSCFRNLIFLSLLIHFFIEDFVSKMSKISKSKNTSYKVKTVTPIERIIVFERD